MQSLNIRPEVRFSLAAVAFTENEHDLSVFLTNSYFSLSLFVSLPSLLGRPVTED